MAQAGSIPKYFTQITTVRFLAQAVFITTAVLQSRTNNKLMDMDSWDLLGLVGIEAYDRRLLRGAYYLESLFALAATVWAWVNVVTEATETTRRSGLKWCFRVDLIGTMFSVISIILQATARNGTRCSGNVARGSVDLGNSGSYRAANSWCHRFYDNFNLTIVMLILCAVPLYLESRWFYHRRLAESRAVSDDWTKNHSDRRQPYLRFLQRAAAPFRFFWRCCCKLGHSSKNPTAWAILYGFFLVPLLIALGIQLFIRGFKLGVKGIRKTLQWKVERDAARASQKAASVREGTEMVHVLPKDSSPTQHGANRATVRTTDTSTYPYTRRGGLLPSTPENPVGADTRSSTPPPIASIPKEQRIAAARRALFPPAKNSSNHKTATQTIINLPIADLLAHPNLFFELISHLHGSDLRVLSKLSKPIRTIILSHRATYGTAMQSYICSRRPQPIGFSSVHDPVSDQWTTSFSTTTISAPNINTTPTLGAPPAPAHNIAQESHHESVPPNASCWGCGIRICGSCAKPKSNLKVSRTEIRLRYLEPVCNACYFRCLCGPAFVRPRTWFDDEGTGRKRKRRRRAREEAGSTDPVGASDATTASNTSPTTPTTPAQTSPHTASNLPTTTPSPQSQFTIARKIFPSLSAKCICTIPKPPRATKYLCRDCEKRHLTELWNMRVRRNARIENDEVPANPTLEVDDQVEGGDGESTGESDDDRNSTTTDANDGPEDRAANTADGHDTASDPHRRHGKRKKQRPVSAFDHTHCIACHSQLWLLPSLRPLQRKPPGSHPPDTITPDNNKSWIDLSWLGYLFPPMTRIGGGKTRGLRWWRCRRCGLEARDTLMSLRREFP